MRKQEEKSLCASCAVEGAEEMGGSYSFEKGEAPPQKEPKSLVFPSVALLLWFLSFTCFMFFSSQDGAEDIDVVASVSLIAFIFIVASGGLGAEFWGLRKSARKRKSAVEKLARLREKGQAFQAFAELPDWRGGDQITVKGEKKGKKRSYYLVDLDERGNVDLQAWRSGGLGNGGERVSLNLFEVPPRAIVNESLHERRGRAEEKERDAWRKRLAARKASGQRSEAMRRRQIIRKEKERLDEIDKERLA